VVLAASLVALTPESATAHEEKPKFTDSDQYRPTPLPDRVVLTWAGDPTTSVDITWRTATGGDSPLAEYAPADKLVGSSILSGKAPGAIRVEGTRQVMNTGEAVANSVQLAGLQPGTMYAYRVGDGNLWSEWFQFRTASTGDEPFTFVYFGDAQNTIRSMWSRVLREANQHAPRAAFMLHAGDLVNRGDNDPEWGEWFAAGGWLNGMIPVVATAGNHEYSTMHGSWSKLTSHWRAQYAFPLNGPKGLEETAYWFDYQGARIISLNSNEQIKEQAAWLEQVLSDPQRPKWTIVTFHHPVFSAAKDRDNPEVRETWKPLFDKHGVDLALQGHDHTYSRSHLGGATENVADGVREQSGNAVYVVSVSGPKMYALQDTWTAERLASGAQLFQVIHVAPEAIRYEARLATGELYDGFRLTKGPDGRNAIENMIPDRPEIKAMTEE
jgi:hypothetical protein